jgi:hypothetical protein
MYDTRTVGPSPPERCEQARLNADDGDCPNGSERDLMVALLGPLRHHPAEPKADREFELD